MQGNVLHVASYGGTARGSFVACLEMLAKELARSGIKQGYLLPSTARDRAWTAELAGDAFVNFLPNDRLGQVKAIREAVRQTGAQVVHTWFSRYDLPAWVATRGTGARVLWHMQSERAVPRTLRWLLTDTIKYRMIGRTTYAVAVSDRVCEWIVERGMPKGRALTVENGADIARVSSPSATRDQLRADLGIRPTTLCLLLFGWEPDRKGVDIALRGLQSLIGEVDLRLLLVADERADRFIHRTLGHDLPDWAPRIKGRQVAADFYAIADIFLSASRLEGFPYAVTEAIASGIPVVSSDIGALAWAKRIPSVAFFPLDRPELLAAAVRTITSWTEEERKARVSKGQRFVCENYSLEAWARRMAAAYRSL